VALLLAAISGFSAAWAARAGFERLKRTAKTTGAIELSTSL